MSLHPTNEATARMVSAARKHRSQARAVRNAKRELAWSQDHQSGCGPVLALITFIAITTTTAVVLFT
jgi:hypothetical protein